MVLHMTTNKQLSISASQSSFVIIFKGEKSAKYKLSTQINSNVHSWWVVSVTGES